ncbi:tol-pal system protein YbgF [Fulvivirgaceae bacterium BMA10]|uniref:Tol-pal system protein YbgF n=1 Tax=Splendidivirga corallicola TaxID=3051826 RepID=A0ABT8KS59_9BACT|nr:tol-pal system protein YbgF [Fulvivirgaceae bacterium BMA10]
MRFDSKIKVHFFVVQVIVLVLALCISPAKAQQQPDSIPSLLNDMNLQIDITEAVNNMYNFKFHDAEVEFNYLKYRFGWHPLPYFLMGLSTWWKIVPDQNETRYDERLLNYMDTAIFMAERLYYQNEKNVEAAFFLAAAHGFKGRLHSERRNWRKAAVSGKNALKFLERSKENQEFSPELLFGDALYNYYSVWIPENYPLLKPILIFFKKGDKKLGLTQLKEVSNNAFYTRTEAQYFLMRILSMEENDVFGGLQIAEYLHQTFPDNSYFHRFYARLLYSTGQYVKAKKISEDIMHKIDNGMIGYETTCGRYAGFFLGQIHESFGDKEKAKEFYQRAVDFSEKAEATRSGYYLYSLLNIGKILKETDKKQAKKYFKLVKKRSKSSHPANKAAKKELSNLRS